MSGKATPLDPDLRVVVTGLKAWEQRFDALFAARKEVELETQALEERLRQLERELTRLRQSLRGGARG